MPVPLDAKTRELTDQPNFPVVATVGPDGGPRTSVVWLAREDDTLLFLTPASSAKARDLGRDPRISLTLFDLANPYRSVEISGTAEISEEGAAALQDALSLKYLGETHESPDDRVRVVVRIVPERISPFPRA